MSFRYIVFYTKNPFVNLGYCFHLFVTREGLTYFPFFLLSFFLCYPRGLKRTTMQFVDEWLLLSVVLLTPQHHPTHRHFNSSRLQTRYPFKPTSNDFPQENPLKEYKKSTRPIERLAPSPCSRRLARKTLLRRRSPSPAAPRTFFFGVSVASRRAFSPPAGQRGTWDAQGGTTFSRMGTRLTSRGESDYWVAAALGMLGWWMTRYGTVAVLHCSVGGRKIG